MIDFIIPSLGRKTIKASLNSIINQNYLFSTDKKWNAFVGFDGLSENDVDPNIIIQDKRIQYFYISQKLGQIGEYGIGNAGLVRNYLISKLNTGNQWVGFLDDDDTIAPYYIDSLFLEIQNNEEFDVCVFRMRYDMGGEKILPPLGTNSLEKDKVGISFCVNKKFLRSSGIKFINDIREDYKFLMDLKDAGARIQVSSYVAYNVKITEGV